MKAYCGLSLQGEDYYCKTTSDEERTLADTHCVFVGTDFSDYIDILEDG